MLKTKLLPLQSNKLSFFFKKKKKKEKREKNVGKFVLDTL